jgi:molybdate transport system substrate-binding protein
VTRAACVALLLLLSATAAAREIVVSAAASLTNAFRDIGHAFEAERPGVKVAFNFAASDILVTQIVKGAPADVFASADQDAMNRGEEAGVIDTATRRDFAANALVLVVPAERTPPPALAGIAAFNRIAAGSPQTVPAGRYAKEALAREKLWGALEPKLVFAQNVRQVLDYVARAEVDAGFVYATDAAIMPGKVRVAFDVPASTPIRYPIAVVKGSKQRALAEAFAAYVASDAGQAVLRKYGFRAP